jgi:hypothetical protein
VTERAPNRMQQAKEREQRLQNVGEQHIKEDADERLRNLLWEPYETHAQSPRSLVDHRTIATGKGVRPATPTRGGPSVMQSTHRRGLMQLAAQYTGLALAINSVGPEVLTARKSVVELMPSPPAAAPAEGVYVANFEHARDTGVLASNGTCDDTTSEVADSELAVAASVVDAHELQPVVGAPLHGRPLHGSAYGADNRRIFISLSPPPLAPAPMRAVLPGQRVAPEVACREDGNSKQFMSVVSLLGCNTFAPTTRRRRQRRRAALFDLNCV